MKKTLTQEVSPEGHKFFLPSKDIIKEEGCPLDRGGVIEDKGRGFFRDIEKDSREDRRREITRGAEVFEMRGKVNPLWAAGEED
ncbi:MAG: hypothetical protein J7L26_12355 [Candidatus Aminicenantes bacterium]|nr:hypothetical protein [Candidatus Aminicenantes bacterium]